jgi:hypothetical protein
MKMMMRMMAAGAVLALASASGASGQTVLDRAVISSGGGTATTTSSRLDYTIAEPATGVASNGQTVGQFGFWMSGATTTLGTGEAVAGVITSLRLGPNPASDVTRLTLTLAAPSTVELTLHDATGRELSRRALGRLNAGEHVMTVDLAGLASGAYSLVALVDGALLRTQLTVVR